MGLPPPRAMSGPRRYRVPEVGVDVPITMRTHPFALEGMPVTAPDPHSPTPAAPLGEAVRAQDADAPLAVTHKWPWRAGEFGTMAFFAAVCFGIGWLTSDRWGVLIGYVAAAGAIALLYRTKVSRVTRSAATATLTGTRLAVTSDGSLGRSAVDLTKVNAIGYRRFGSDECFMLSDGTQGVRLPVRLLSDPTLRGLFDAAWAGALDISPTAEDLHQRLC